jgi:ribulose kinase
MAEGPYLLGIDYGTGGVRVGLFDRDGSPAVFHAVEFETSHPRPGWAEQDPDTWWSSLVQAAHGAMQQSGVSPEEITGIGVDTTASTVLALDDNDRHLRPAIMWMDVRASDQAVRIQETGDPALKYNGFGAVSGEWGLPKCLWLKEQEPKTWQAARHITGSSHTLSGQVAEPIHGHGFWGAYTDAVMPGQDTVEAGQASTGTLVAWFKNRFAKGATEEATKRGVDPYVVLNELARDVPVGSDGLIVVDYFQGNRTPHTDSLVRGMIWSLSLAHGEGHLFRAILEGICYGTEDCLQTFRTHKFEPTLNVASGGPTKSELWMQIHADVSGVPISFTKVGDGPVLGSAMLGGGGGRGLP